ncbi:nitrous oxide reductase family maturation protein NosD [Alkalilimnicola ehrlichii]|uniref:nitrous oxide reductase family maturation protein NosD n=1 Tax=Alkalilimnicola ehrlichii TaxID=351052 RepID=UPI002161A0A1|nr:nitrous oxide reductase family maturation protein NosD [Alkalilimnicola ehrlichii]
MYRGLIFSSALMLFLLVQTAAAAMTVRPDDGALQTIIDRVEPGAELVLEAGVYRGGIVIDKPLTLRGRPGAVIDAGGEGDVVRVTAADVRLEGLILRNSGFNLTEANAAVYGDRGANNIKIVNNRMENSAFGIWLWHLEGAVARDNDIVGRAEVRSQDRGDGLRLYNIDRSLFVGNTVRDTRDGVYIDTSREVEFRDNSFSDLRYGIHYMYSHHGRIVGNDSRRTRSGYALMMSNFLEVVGNTSVDDHNYGFLLNFVRNSTVAENRVERVTGWHGPAGREHGVTLGSEGKAIFIYNSQGNEIRDNVFAQSEIGIHLTAGSEQNRIYGNSFLHNQTQVRYVATREQEWSYNGRGNYWSDYLGWDLSGDGIGDTPYEPNDAVDRLLWKYPLAKVLMNSPAIQVLRWAQRQFPVFRPQGVRDSAPLMRMP